MGRFRFTNRSVPRDGRGAQAEQLGLKEANSSCGDRAGGRKASEAQEQALEGSERNRSD